VLCIDSTQSGEKPAPIGNLNAQSRPGVKFQDHRTLFPIDYDIDAYVTEACHFLGKRRNSEDFLPIGDFNPLNGLIRIGVSMDDPIMVNTMEGDALI
jgi:hypothetical protein